MTPDTSEARVREFEAENQRLRAQVEGQARTIGKWQDFAGRESLGNTSSVAFYESKKVAELRAQLAMAEAAAGEAGRLVARFRSQRDELRAEVERLQRGYENALIKAERQRQDALLLLGRIGARLPMGNDEDRLAVEAFLRVALLPAPTDEDKPGDA